MKGTWMKKLSAFALALIMLVGMVPAASAASADITYYVDAGDTVSFDRDDFERYYNRTYSNDTFRYVEFTSSSSLKSSNGTLYHDYGASDEKELTSSNLSNYSFYYSSSATYRINKLSFKADRGADDATVTLSFRAYGDSYFLDGTLKLEIDGSTSSSKADINYSVDAGDEVALSRSDFKNFFEDEYANDTLRYVIFTADSSLKSADGTLYYDYGGDDEEELTTSNIEDYSFYYGSGTYRISKMSFKADRNADDATITLPFRAYGDTYRLSGTLTITIGDGDSSSADIAYTVDPGDELAFSRKDFKDFYEDEYSNDTFEYVVFTADSSLKSSVGTLYHDYGSKDEESFSRSDLEDYDFYYKSDDYLINSLTFVAEDDAINGSVVTLEFRAYGYDDHLDGVLTITIGDEISTSGSHTGDITYHVQASSQVEFDRSDFDSFLQTEKSGESLRFVEFETDSTFSKSTGMLYYDYDGKDEESFSVSDLEDYRFYYSSSSYGDYPLNDLTFVTGSSFKSAVTLEFRAYYTNSKYVEGTLVLTPETVISGDIVYRTTYNTNVQINPNDIARLFRKAYPTSTLESVRITGAPDTGTLYYNYYGTSSYGGGKTALNSSLSTALSFMYSPTAASQYSLNELTYVPSTTNYCDVITFTAYGSGSKTLTGSILISVTLASVADVYGATPQNTSVSFPASAIYSAVISGTGNTLGSIRLLKLPDTTQGTVYLGTGSTKADTATCYTYSSSGSQRISQLRFVPVNGYTGSVEIPYVAYNTNGTAIAAGTFSLGVVKALKTFTDVDSSTWCYKYVTELSDAGVIDGYTNGSFQPNNTVTYGAALKLIMLAAGYSEQAPTVSGSPFSGYLAKAKSDGLVSGSVNLSGAITRLTMAQIAAKALKLDVSSLPSQKPFTDTNDIYVQALNAAGVVEGYFSNGTSTFKPSNTLTRGQLSAIVWRMERLAD